MSKPEKQAYIYILQCSDGTLYTGWTNDPDKRLAAHNSGHAAKYTRSRRPVRRVYLEPATDSAAARRRECGIKKLTRAQKLQLINSNCYLGEKSMSYIPTYEQAQEILNKYNKEAFHLRHAKIVSGVMRWFAKQHDPEREMFWAVVGLLHDLDFELFPDEHCVRTEALMRELDLDENIIKAACSHGYGMTSTLYKPELYMEKILFAIDELTGLIGAAAMMRPSKSVSDLEVKSVKKKYKTPAFAAGCSREVIAQGADMLGMELDELIEKTILAMRSLMGEMEI